MITRNLFTKLNNYSQKTEIPVSIKKLVAFSPKQKSIFNQFTKQDLMIRLAKRSKELELLPYGLGLLPSIENVISWYIKSFQDMDKISINDSIKYKKTLFDIFKICCFF